MKQGGDFHNLRINQIISDFKCKGLSGEKIWAMREYWDKWKDRNTSYKIYNDIPNLLRHANASTTTYKEGDEVIKVIKIT